MQLPHPRPRTCCPRATDQRHGGTKMCPRVPGRGRRHHDIRNDAPLAVRRCEDTLRGWACWGRGRQVEDPSRTLSESRFCIRRPGAWESAFLTGSRRCCWSTERTLSSEQGGEVLLLLVCDSRVFLPLSCWCELGSAGPRKGTVSSEF